MQIQLDPAGFLSELKSIKNKLNTPNLILQSVGQSLLNANQQRHRKNLAPDGTPWTPLAASTITAATIGKSGKKAETAARNKSARMLYQFGDLLRFSSQVMGGGGL